MAYLSTDINLWLVVAIIVFIWTAIAGVVFYAIHKIMTRKEDKNGLLPHERNMPLTWSPDQGFNRRPTLEEALQYHPFGDAVGAKERLQNFKDDGGDQSNIERDVRMARYNGVCSDCEN